MKDEASYVCDSCGEEIVLPIDLSAGSEQEYVEENGRAALVRGWVANDDIPPLAVAERQGQGRAAGEVAPSREPPPRLVGASVRRGPQPIILVSNTKSLLSAVLPGRGITSLDRLQKRAFDGIRACMTALGYESLSQTVIFTDSGPVRFAKALNRSVSGSMNELVKCAEVCMSEGERTLPEVGDRLNGTLLSALAAGGSQGYGKPREAFLVMVGGAVPNAPRIEAGDRGHGHEQPPPD